MNKRKLGIIILISYFVYTIYLAFVPIDIFNLNIEDFSALQKTMYFLATDLILILALFLVYRKDFKKDLADFKINYRDYLDMGIKFWIIGLLIMGGSNLIIQTFITGEIAANEESIRTLLKSFPLYMVFATCLYAPFVEETIFRKTLKDVIGYNLIFVLTSGLLFGALHVIGSATEVIDLVYIIPYSSLGIAFAYLYYKTKNIFVPMAIHMIHNSIFIALEIIIIFS